jgi:flagellar assembly protein FliH
MTSKLIKQGTKRALGIQHFLFKEDFHNYSPSIEMEQTGDILGVGAVAPEAVSPEEKTVVPEIDTEKLESEAYQKGFQEGEITAREETGKKIESVMKRYADSIEEISRIKSYLYSRTEKEVVRLAIEIAKKIVGREIKADRSIIQTLVRVALSRVTEKASVTLRLNPLDYKFMMEQNDALAKAEGCGVTLQSDNSIEQGGCLVETSCGDIDARIGEEFREVEDAFFADLK